MKKGRVSSLENGRAVVIPQGTNTRTTCPLMVPDRILDELKPGTWVVYDTFPDCTGIVLETMDG